MNAPLPWLAWSLFALYLAATFWLAWLGHKRTKSFAEFALGKRDMGPWLTGMTLGACLASTATFVINPGFVYRWGLPALMALTVPLILGIFAGLFMLGPGFRRHGATAVTLPAWLGQRYGSEGLRVWFAALSLLHVFYMVLIVVGAALVMQHTMGVSYLTGVIVTVAVVFSYVFFGGTYAHAYTNTAQGAVMLVVAVLIAGAALLELGGPVAAADALRSQDASLVALTNPDSPFYRHWVEVLVVPFAIGFALVAQPHLLVKTLYLKDSKDMAKFTLVGGGCFVIFSLVLLSGLAARVKLGADLRQDAAAATWIAGAFPASMGAFVSVAVLAAAMSTLDGLLVAVSAIVGADLIGHPAVAAKMGITDEAGRQRAALNAGRAAVVALGVISFLVAWSPPALVGIFGTVGTYGLLVASLPALVWGVLLRRPPSALGVGLASAIGLGVHLGICGWHYATQGDWNVNTGLTAAAGLAVALPVPFVIDGVRSLIGLPAAAPEALVEADTPSPEELVAA